MYSPAGSVALPTRSRTECRLSGPHDSVRSRRRQPARAIIEIRNRCFFMGPPLGGSPFLWPSPLAFIPVKRNRQAKNYNARKIFFGPGRAANPGCAGFSRRGTPRRYVTIVVSMTPQQPPPKLHLVNTPEYREHYANSVQIRVNLWDFFLMFGTVQQSAPDSVTIQNFQGIYVSPQQAKALLNVLNAEHLAVRGHLRRNQAGASQPGQRNSVTRRAALIRRHRSGCLPHSPAVPRIAVLLGRTRAVRSGRARHLPRPGLGAAFHCPERTPAGRDGLPCRWSGRFSAIRFRPRVRPCCCSPVSQFGWSRFCWRGNLSPSLRGVVGFCAVHALDWSIRCSTCSR